MTVAAAKAGEEGGVTWEPGRFLVANRWGSPNTVSGYVYRDLGLYIAFRASPKGRRPPTWGLTHLGSGHAVCGIVGTMAKAFPIATAIAECGDWSFDGLLGWKNVEPELPQRVMAILKAHPDCCFRWSGGSPDEDSAREIAMARHP